MREALFIKKNVEKWNKYQHTRSQNADEAADRFITIMDDLAYSRTFYPRSKVTKWLNGLASGIYQNIYQNKKEKYSRIAVFWKYELPLLFRKYHKILLFAFIVFASFVAIGAFSSRENPDFVRGVMGDEYVNMTEKNIADGDPFGVYKDDSKFAMFMRIAFNNLRVATTTFLSGITLGIGTLYLLWKNGIMIGSFQYMFFANGLGWQSILVIWIHGTIELSSIVIAGTAGFILAYGLLFPGTYTVRESLRRRGSEAAKLMVALAPFIVLAAFFESYVTYLMNNTFSKEGWGLPIWAGATILILSAILMTWYFIIWPIILNRKGYYLVKTGVANKYSGDD